MNEAWPTLVALAIAILGATGGFAALMKVNADNSKTVSEGATNVVKMMREQIDALDSRVEVVERYAEEMETWSDKVTDLLEKAIEVMPADRRDPFRLEAAALASSRPRRGRSRSPA